MNDEKNIINAIGVDCFELILLFDEYNRQTLMEMLTRRLQKTLKTTHVEILIYNRWHLRGESMRFSHHSKKRLEQLNIDVFNEYFKNNPDLLIVKKSEKIITDHHIGNSYLLKLYSKDEFSGFLYLTFDDNEIISPSFLKSIKSKVNKFLINFYQHRNERYQLQREQVLFNLSTKLHAVHQTDELLRVVLHSVEELFPNFEFAFLMSNEYEDSNLPIKFIEYETEKPLSPAIKAFINNQLEVDKNNEDNTTALYIPLGGEQSVYGVIKWEAPYLLDISDSLVNFINRSVTMIGKALERTMMYQESTKQIADLQLINQTTHRLNLNLNSEEIISILKEKICQSCYPENVVAVLFDENDKKIIQVNENTSYFHSITGQIFIDYILSELEKTKDAMFLGDLQQEEELNFPFKSIMAFPLKSDQHLMGLIIIVHTQPYYFSFDRFKLIQSIVQHASLALSNTLLKEQLKQTVITDYLTHLYSRNFLDEVITDHMEKGKLSSFILFDIDNFKEVNDTYGHYVGDKVLVQIARIIEEITGDIGVAARWGGEEFAIYLPEKNINEAVEVADILRGKVKNNTEPQVSISCGVSMWEKSFNEGIKSLFVRTDMALYKAKGSGKNKVITDILL